MIASAQALVAPTFIVADAGPLIALAVGGVLPVCIAMLGGLMVPEAVLDECTSDISAPGAAILQDLHRARRFQTIPSASLMPLDASFAHGLGGGEIAVLSYAAQNGLLVLIDERRARRAADRLGGSVIGSGTVLAQLKQQGLIDSVKPVLSAWRQHGYFVSGPVLAGILRLANES